MDTNCYDYLMNLALDSKDYGWAGEIKRMRDEHVNSKETNCAEIAIEINLNDIFDTDDYINALIKALKTLIDE